MPLRCRSSSSLHRSASLTICSICSLLSRSRSLEIVILLVLPHDFSVAVTFMIPLASRSNDTSIWGTPRGAGAIPSSLNLPSMLLSLVSPRSPSKTWIRTSVWLSWYVEKTWDALHGIWRLRSMIFVITPPDVSIPRDSGVISRRIISSVRFDSFPLRIKPWTAAPYATASSGFTLLHSSFPLKKSCNSACTFGIRVDPPTKTISCT
mmetsp:Transcript_122380/g.182880  ORF Transcript_122380/g.182880 Transcript_122380/m.182880 type:complete len:207 (-) Transcript_122380:1024-1644(-)